MLTEAANAMHRDTNRSDPAVLVVIMPNLDDLMKPVRASTFSWRPGSSLFFALYLCSLSDVRMWVAAIAYGSAGLLPVSAFEKDIFGECVEKRRG